MAYEFTSGSVVTANDSAILPRATRALYVGTGGNLSVKMLTGANTANTELTFNNVANGTVLEIRVVGVKSTGTTANNIIALF